MPVLLHGGEWIDEVVRLQGVGEDEVERGGHDELVERQRDHLDGLGAVVPDQDARHPEERRDKHEDLAHANLGPETMFFFDAAREQVQAQERQEHRQDDLAVEVVAIARDQAILEEWHEDHVHTSDKPCLPRRDSDQTILLQHRATEVGDAQQRRVEHQLLRVGQSQ